MDIVMDIWFVALQSRYGRSGKVSKVIATACSYTYNYRWRVLHAVRGPAIHIHHHR